MIQTLKREHHTINAQKKKKKKKKKKKGNYQIQIQIKRINKVCKTTSTYTKNKTKHNYNKLITIEQQIDEQNDSNEAGQPVSELYMTRKELGTPGKKLGIWTICRKQSISP